MLGRARFMVMSMHDQLNCLGVIPVSNLVIVTTGPMGVSDAYRPRKNERHESQCRRDRPKTEAHAREYSGSLDLKSTSGVRRSTRLGRTPVHSGGLQSTSCSAHGKSRLRFQVQQG